MTSKLHGGPVSPWPRRIRRLAHICTAGLATVTVAVIVSIGSLIVANVLGPSGPLVVSIALAISTVVLFLLRGAELLSVAFAGGTFVAATSHSTGIDFLVAGEAWISRFWLM